MRIASLQMFVFFAIMMATSLPSRATQQDQASDSAASLDFVNRDDDFVLIVRPAKLVAEKPLQKVVRSDSIKRILDPVSKKPDEIAGFKFTSLDQLTLVRTLVGDQETGRFPETFVIMSMKGKTEFNALIGNSKPRTIGDLEYYVARRNLYGMRYCRIIDDRTVVWAYNSQVLERFSKRKRKGTAHQADWRVTWRNFEKDRIVFVAGKSLLRPLAKTPLPKEIATKLRPMFNASYLVGSMAIEERTMKLFGEMMFRNPQEAKKVATAIRESADAAKAQLSALNPSTLTPAQKASYKLVQSILNRHRINAEHNRIVGSVSFEFSLEQIAPLLNLQLEMTHRTQSANNLKQLTIGLHNYHEQHGKLPSAVMVHKSGNHYSWRVAILPYLNEQELYDQYRFDQKWDSPVNQRVTKQIPAVFKHPSAAPDSLLTNYFAVVGDGAVFDGSVPTDLTQVQDGTVNTIMLVEGRQKTHWAKPEDILFDLKSIRKHVGGFTEEGANTAFCDGSVRFIAKDIGPDVLYQLITRSGGDFVDLSKLDRK